MFKSGENKTNNQQFKQRVKWWEAWIVDSCKELTQHNVETAVTRKFLNSIGQMPSHEQLALQVAEDSVIKTLITKQNKSL